MDSLILGVETFVFLVKEWISISSIEYLSLTLFICCLKGHPAVSLHGWDKTLKSHSSVHVYAE